jgi:Tfp pilus assembly protein FimV
MAEYAMVTAAVALLAVSLLSPVGKAPAQLPRTAAAAIRLVSANARAKKVSVAGARTAYAKAPYAKPALKYIYAVGWITGTKNPASCFYTVSTSDAVKEAAGELRGNAKVASRLRSRGVTPQQAGTALVKGISAACS